MVTDYTEQLQRMEAAAGSEVIRLKEALERARREQQEAHAMRDESEKAARYSVNKMGREQADEMARLRKDLEAAEKRAADLAR